MKKCCKHPMHVAGASYDYQSNSGRVAVEKIYQCIYCGNMEKVMFTIKVHTTVEK